jgi:hypothetical protein
MYYGAVSILGAIGLTLIYFYIINIPAIFARIFGVNLRKPFSCSFCMSFWISFIYLLFNTNTIEAIFISSTTPFIYLIVEDFITNKFEL